MYCAKCKKEKKMSEFHKNEKYQCKACKKQANHMYYHRYKTMHGDYYEFGHENPYAFLVMPVFTADN